MSHEICKTVRIKSTDPKTQGAFVEINECDFNDKVHTLFQPTVPAPVAPTPIRVGNENPPPPAPVNATDKALELAADAGIDITSVVGTGKNGKVTAEDVEAAIENLTEPGNAGEGAE